METIKRKSGGQPGHVISKETREKISRAVTNNHPRYWLGKKMSVEHRKKLRENHRGMSGKKQPKSWHLAMDGEKNWNWQGGITPKNLKIRNSLPYKEWRKEVFTRDDFTCQICGVRGVEIHADHIEAFSVIMKKHNIDSFQAALICADLWNVSNGRTLCVPCHKKTPNYAGRIQRYD